MVQPSLEMNKNNGQRGPEVDESWNQKLFYQRVSKGEHSLKYFFDCF